MVGSAESPIASAPAPETTSMLLGIFSDLYRQEVAAEEDVHRTLPFFGAALGLVLASLAYAAGRLPRWSDLPTKASTVVFCLAAALLGMAFLEAGFALLWLSAAIARRNYQRIGPEPALRMRMADLESLYRERGVTAEEWDRALTDTMRTILLDSYTAVTPVNRGLNQRRYKLRAIAASHLMRSLIWALAATSIIFAADKSAYLPKPVP